MCRFLFSHRLNIECRPLHRQFTAVNFSFSILNFWLNFFCCQLLLEANLLKKELMLKSTVYSRQHIFWQLSTIQWGLEHAKIFSSSSAPRKMLLRLFYSKIFTCVFAQKLLLTGVENIKYLTVYFLFLLKPEWWNGVFSFCCSSWGRLWLLLIVSVMLESVWDVCQLWFCVMTSIHPSICGMQFVGLS